MSECVSECVCESVCVCVCVCVTCNRANHNNARFLRFLRSTPWASRCGVGTWNGVLKLICALAGKTCCVRLDIQNILFPTGTPVADRHSLSSVRLGHPRDEGPTESDGVLAGDAHLRARQR